MPRECEWLDASTGINISKHAWKLFVETTLFVKNKWYIPTVRYFNHFICSLMLTEIRRFRKDRQ